MPFSATMRSRAASQKGITDAASDRKSTTSELQSRLHLVCRLLLEKKKKNQLIDRGLHHPPVKTFLDLVPERLSAGPVLLAVLTLVEELHRGTDSGSLDPAAVYLG